ncbi:MAG TPA: phage holin family protein [Halanaerobiales bacterium]|nr:phage holin family protein [Halanaerobiales bacterium]
MATYQYEFKKKRKGLLAKLLITMVALFITAYIIPGMSIQGLFAGFVAALILGIVNVVVKPIFIVLTLPLTILTMGLFLLVVNGLMLMLSASLVPGFMVAGFWSAVFGAILLSIVTWFLNSILD